MSVVLQSSGGGSVTLQEPSTASNYTLSLPARTGTAITSADSGTVTQGMIGTNVGGTGPAFFAYAGSSTSFTSGVETKVPLNTEVFDTNSNFDSSTNYRFTPTVAGYYLFTFSFWCRFATTFGEIYSTLYKNGSSYLYGSRTITTLSTAASSGSGGSAIIYMNGSTDYVELYGLASGSGTFTLGAGASIPAVSYLTGSLIRGA